MSENDRLIGNVRDLVESKAQAMRVVVYLMSVYGIKLEDFIDELLEYQR